MHTYMNKSYDHVRGECSVTIKIHTLAVSLEYYCNEMLPDPIKWNQSRNAQPREHSVVIPCNLFGLNNVNYLVVTLYIDLTELQYWLQVFKPHVITVRLRVFSFETVLIVQ